MYWLEDEIAGGVDISLKFFRKIFKENSVTISASWLLSEKLDRNNPTK